ncbi:ALF repeat-containing protein [Kitasatospora sp. NPDC002040]|uniref:ALF repeat-containing protein n=1 Tax=Kitasatospora sp. NPDC002040 TaxID=3154661 RepID=UPI00332C220F
MKLSRVSAVLTAVALTPAILFPTSAGAADSTTPAGVSAKDAPDQADEDNLVAILRIIADKNTGRALMAAAQKAMDGTAADRVYFLTTGRYLAQLLDDRVRVARAMGEGGPAVQAAARAALDVNTAEAIHEFLTTGLAKAQSADRVTVSRLAETEGPAVRKAALAALEAGDYKAIGAFFNGGQEQARTEDRIATTRLMSVGGPTVRKAANAALSGSYADIAEFLNHGWAKADAEDKADAKAAEDKAAAEKAAADKAAAEKAAADQAAAEQAAKDKAAVTQAKLPGTPAVAPATTTGHTELAATGADSDLPWQIGGGAAALGLGAALLVASRRRPGIEV